MSPAPEPRDGHHPQDDQGRHTADARHDIETRADVERLVREFYTTALADPTIGFLFSDVAKLDLDHHIPRVTRFWETIVLGADTYSGGVFRPHLELHQIAPLRAGHFERWLLLWRAKVDELFVGEHAEQAKTHAARVARAFSDRLMAIDASAAQSVEDPVASGWSAPAIQVIQVDRGDD